MMGNVKNDRSIVSLHSLHNNLNLNSMIDGKINHKLLKRNLFKFSNI